MNQTAGDSSEQSFPTWDWKPGALGFLAGSAAGLCCAGPLLLGTVGFSGIAGILSSMPFVYHVMLQWIALGIIIGTWVWFLFHWLRRSSDQRWNLASITTGLFLLGMTIYVLRSWATHVLI